MIIVGPNSQIVNEEERCAKTKAFQSFPIPKCGRNAKIVVNLAAGSPSPVMNGGQSWLSGLLQKVRRLLGPELLRGRYPYRNRARRVPVGCGLQEINVGFGMERLSWGTLAAKAFSWVCRHNLVVLCKLLAMPSAWRCCQVRTVRWRLYQLAGKVVCYASAVM